MVATDAKKRTDHGKLKPAGIVKAITGYYTDKTSNQERTATMEIGCEYENMAKGANEPKSVLKLKATPFPQISSNGQIQCWLMIFPKGEGEPQSNTGRDRLKKSGDVKTIESYKDDDTGEMVKIEMVIGAEFTSQKGRKMIKLEVSPLTRMHQNGTSECVLYIFAA